MEKRNIRLMSDRYLIEDIKLNKESDAVSSKHTLQKTKKHFILKFERQSKPSEEKGDQCM